MASYYVDNFEVGLFPAHSSEHATPDLSSSLRFDAFVASHGISTDSLPSSANGRLRSSSSNNNPPAFPSYDPDSPFNSPHHFLRQSAGDGMLKTTLMGIGSDGGFLTSPIVHGNARMPNNNAGDIQIGSPAPTSGLQNSTNGDDVAEVRRPRTSSSNVGMGIGISGVDELQQALEMGDFGNPNLKIYGLPKDGTARSRTTSELGYLPYPEHLPTTTLGRGKNNLRDVGPTPADEPRFVEHRFKSPPPQAEPPVAPMTGRRPRKNLTIKTVNKAKSCSSLRYTPAPNTMEPLTPISSHGASFFGLPGVPFDSPGSDDAAIAGDQTITQYTFADLYNMSNPVDEANGGKTSYQYAKNAAENQSAAYPDDTEFALLHGLPTPLFAEGSGFSSPSSSYLSDPSPELGPQAVPMMHPQLSSHSMLSAPSMDNQTYSLPIPSSAGRQRCATYGSRSAQQDDVLDPALVSPQHMQRHASNPGYAAPRYAYPTRFSSDQGQAGPYQQAQHQPQQQASSQQQVWTNQQHPSPYGGPPVEQNHFYTQSPYQSAPMERNLDSYEQNLEAFEDIYEALSGASSGHRTPGKRGRGDDDDDDYNDHFSPTSNDGHIQTRKRLRTVASAPNLPTISTPSRRMRPGPKPKVTKSPQEACQSVFSAILSPPPIPYRRGASPYGSDGSGLLGSDDEGEHQNGQSSVPKEIIQSLYSGVPSHVGPNGTKVPKRYLCLMEGCERTFPRKSAIESHIQTHLEDKPFICPQPDCDASFVRQHDLRRHERIHSGNKPFPCPCGKGFARGDALARHRARGICSGSLVPRRI